MARNRRVWGVKNFSHKSLDIAACAFRLAVNGGFDYDKSCTFAGYALECYRAPRCRTPSEVWNGAVTSKHLYSRGHRADDYKRAGVRALAQMAYRFGLKPPRADALWEEIRTTSLIVWDHVSGQSPEALPDHYYNLQQQLISAFPETWTKVGVYLTAVCGCNQSMIAGPLTDPQLLSEYSNISGSSIAMLGTSLPLRTLSLYWALDWLGIDQWKDSSKVYTAYQIAQPLCVALTMRLDHVAAQPVTPLEILQRRSDTIMIDRLCDTDALLGYLPYLSEEQASNLTIKAIKAVPPALLRKIAQHVIGSSKERVRMFPMNSKPQPIEIEYDKNGERVRKWFPNAIAARRFYMAKERAGKNPKVKRAQSRPEEEQQ